MQSQKFTLNRTQKPISKRKAGLLVFSVAAIAGAAVFALSSSEEMGHNQLFFGANMQDEHHQAFMDFMVKHGRTYTTKNELLHRFETFKKNFQAIRNHNEANSFMKKTVNQFSDMTEEEFDQYFHRGLRLKENHVPKKRLGQALEGIDVPKSVDWNLAGKVSTPQNQKNCGSCWAFTTATTLESLKAINEDLDVVPNFSVQYLIDCDPVNIGCGGGWMMDAYDFTQKEGIATEDDYHWAYSAREHSCDNDSKKKSNFKNSGAEEEDEISNQRMKELLTKNPVGVAMYSNQSCLMSYSHGIVTESDCKCSDPNRQLVNHAVTIVGYGQSKNYMHGRPDCDEYWIIKNSWGSNWGENGFFNLCMDRTDATQYGTCQVNLYAQYPKY